MHKNGDKRSGVGRSVDSSNYDIGSDMVCLVVETANGGSVRIDEK